MFLLVLLIAPLINAGASGFGQIDIKSNCPDDLCTFFDNPNGVWVFSWIDEGQSTDKVNAYFSKSDLEDETGSIPKQSFSINIEGTKNSCKYDIKREANMLDIFSVTIAHKNEVFWAWKYNEEQLKAKLLEWKEELGCTSIDGYVGGYPHFEDIITLNSPLTDRLILYCYTKKDTLGRLGSLQNLKYITETKWTLESEGKSLISKTISNDVCSKETEFCEGKSTRLGNDALIKWNGQLSSGDTCPSMNTELMAYDSEFDGNWRIIDKFSYTNDYSSYMVNSLEEQIRRVACYEAGDNIPASCLGVSKISAVTLETIINNKAGKSIEERDTGYTPIIEDESISNGRVRFDLNRLIRFPLFILYVDSDYLELEISTGVPKLSKTLDGYCQPDKELQFLEGGLEQAQANIKALNIGNGKGGFEMRIKSCDDGGEAGDSITFILNKNALAIKTLKITGATLNGKKREGNCLVELKESTTQQADTCKLGFSVDVPADCVIGRVWCSYHNGKPVIKHCPNGREEVKQTCLKGQVCDIDDMGNPLCRTITCKKDKDCQSGSVCKNGVCVPDDDKKCKDWTIIPGFAGWDGWKIPNIFCIIKNWIEKFRVPLAIVLGFLGGLTAFLYSRRFITEELIEENKYRYLTYFLIFLVLGGTIGYLSYVYFWLIFIILLILLLLKIFI